MKAALCLFQMADCDCDILVQGACVLAGHGSECDDVVEDMLNHVFYLLAVFCGEIHCPSHDLGAYLARSWRIADQKHGLDGARAHLSKPRRANRFFLALYRPRFDPTAPWKPLDAIQDLEKASPYDLLCCTSFAQATMYSVYVRAEAYLKAGRGQEAAAEYQKILGHRGLMASQPIAALARLGVAPAYAQQGKKEEARAAFQDFLTPWKDADPDIPILKQAKAEYAKLK